MESNNTNLLSDATDIVKELKTARNKKVKKSSEKTPTLSENTMKGEIIQCVETFMEVTKSLTGSRKRVKPSDELSDSIKAAIDILNNTEDVEVASPF